MVLAQTRYRGTVVFSVELALRMRPELRGQNYDARTTRLGLWNQNTLPTMSIRFLTR